ELSDLLDFTSASTDALITHRFECIASALLHEYYLLVISDDTRNNYEILEVEFYLKAADVHDDPFTHGSEEQRYSGQWYFHRAPRRSKDPTVSQTAASGYRGGTRKGLDLTMGAPPVRTSPYFAPSAQSTPCEPPIRGGVLLRTIRRISDAKVISGPSLLVDEVLRASGAASIAELVATQWGGDISAFSVAAPAACRLQLTRRVAAPATRPQVYRSPRIGLDLSSPDIPADGVQQLAHPRVVFVGLPYRYFVHPHLLTANGRGQTLLGVYDACTAADPHEDEARLSEVVRLTGLKDATVQKYLSEYRVGLQGGGLKPFLGVAGKGASASPTTFMRMMGTL
ncbi:hypothetical protein POSPLADRAFT_1078945, partial [Postia placenta MAD-698-R-SB12]